MTTSLAPSELIPTEKSTSPQQVQRLRLIFSQQGVLRYVGHLDLVRTWERALRRASVPLAYSEGLILSRECSLPPRCHSAQPDSGKWLTSS